MSEFDKLTTAYKNWHEQHLDYEKTSTQFAYRFARGFREYVGAPEYFTSLGGETKTQYVEALKLDDQKKLIPPDNLLDLLARDDDGYFEFGVRVFLEMAPKTFPKLPFGFHVRFRLMKEECEIEIAGRKFSFKLDDDSARRPVYEVMVDVLKRELSREPWEVTEKQQIGFLPLSRGD